MPESSNRLRYWIGALFVLVAAFCFAMKGILIKLAYQYNIDAVTLLTLRMLMALPFYAVTAFYWTKRLPPANLALRQWIMLAILGMTGYYLASYFNFIGLMYITASLERILLFTYPSFVLLMNTALAYWKGDSAGTNRLQWFALALTYIGIVIAFSAHIGTDEQHNLLLGAFWVILSGLVYAIYLVGSDRMIELVGPQRFTSYALLAATAPIVIQCWFKNGLVITNYPLAVYLLAGLIAIFTTVIPTFLIAEGIKRVGSGNASILGSIGPIFNIFVASALLSEHISVQQWVGTLLVLSGVFLIGWRGKW